MVLLCSRTFSTCWEHCYSAPKNQIGTMPLGAAFVVGGEVLTPGSGRTGLGGSEAGREVIETGDKDM